MPRTILSDTQWNFLQKLFKHVNIGYIKHSDRLFFEGILFMIRTGMPWRDLPSYFGHWNTVYKRFNRWARKAGFLEILLQLAQIADKECVFADGTIIQAHQHSTGAATDSSETIGKSRGGNSTKIHLVVDSFGLPIYFELSEGQKHDVTHAESLIKHIGNFKCFIADKGFDSQALRDLIFSLNKTSVIPKHNYGKDLNPDSIDKHLYKIRHLVENAFARIKHYRAIATRYDKLEICFSGTVAIAFIMMWLPMYV